MRTGNGRADGRTARQGRSWTPRGETWAGVDAALNNGARGLTGRISLAQLLAVKRGIRNQKRLPPYTVAQIRRWAEAHFRRTGAWPNASSGPVWDAPGET
jgi:hypothetical protein